MTDAVAEGYDDFFYLLAAWEHTTITPYVQQEYWIDSESDTYIMPEFFENKDVTLSNIIPGVESDLTLVYSNNNLIKLLEDAFFKRATKLSYKSQITHRLDSFFSVLTLLLVS